jgi:hypothetical protein
MSNSRKKYRPYLTLAELEVIQSALDFSSRELDCNSIYKYLSKYISDIRSGYRAENHVLKPGIEERLGIESVSQDMPSAEDFEKAESELIKHIPTYTEEPSP